MYVTFLMGQNTIKCQHLPLIYKAHFMELEVKQVNGDGVSQY